jgi:hypothetical protein
MSISTSLLTWRRIFISAFNHSDVRRLALGMTFPALLGIVCGTVNSIWPNFGILFFVACILSLGWWTVRQFLHLVTSFFRRAYLRSLRFLILLLVALPIAMISLQSGPYIHLILFYPTYHKEIQEWRGDPDHISFDWGTATGLLTSNAQTTLYYDRNDNLENSLGTKSSSDNYDGPPDLFEITKHLFGHFYTVTLWHL